MRIEVSNRQRGKILRYYDDSDHLIRQEFLNECGQLTLATIMYVDGIIIKYVMLYYDNGNIWQIHEYSRNGKIKNITSYNESGNINSFKNYNE